MSLAELESLGLLDLLDVELARALGRMTKSASPEIELAVVWLSEAAAALD